MLRILIKKILPVFTAFCTVCFSSCVLFQPLPLKPIHNSDSIQSLDKSNFSKISGDYEIVSVDSNSTRLDYAFTYKYMFDLKDLPGKNIYMNLSVIDDRRLKATLYLNDKKVKSKTIKGKINNNYFQFHSNYWGWQFIFIVYAKQTNRIALSYESDLYLDTNAGGVAFFLILPVPLSGSSSDTYNLKFKRRKTSGL